MTKVSINLDVQTILDGYVEDNQGYNLKRYLYHKVQGTADSFIKEEVEKKLKGEGLSIDPQQLVGTYMGHLNEQIKLKLNGKFEESVQKYIQNLLDSKLEMIISEFIKNYIKDKYYPIITKIINDTIIVNQKDLQEEQENMEQYMNDAINGAYEQGQMNMAKEIKNNL